MGNASSLEENFGRTTPAHDIAAKRRCNKTSFQSEINHFKQSHPELFQISDDSQLLKSSGLIVTARKRPLNEQERNNGDYDVVSCGKSLFDSTSTNQSSMWVHKCGIRLDMQHMYIDHHGYQFDYAFNEQDSTEIIYDKVVKNLVQKSLDGDDSSIILFGATGSGKTYTINGLFSLAMNSIFLPSTQLSHKYRFKFAAVEVTGTRIKDLISGNAVNLLEDDAGSTNLVGCNMEYLASLQEAMHYYNYCKKVRTTHATGVHDASSRSHAMYKLYLERDDGQVGSLTFVDLAGSEWSRDQISHDEERRQESKEINTSLMTLKQCLQNRISIDRGAEGVRIPYRNSKLTRLLKENFTKSSSCTLVVATISPGSSDTEHSQDVLALTSLKPQDSAGLEEHGRNGQVVLTSNVSGTATFDTSVYQEEAIVNSLDKNKLMNECSDLPCNPMDWSPSDVCRWWVEVATSAVEEVKNENTKVKCDFEVLLSAKVWVSLRLDSKDSIGLSLDYTPGQQCPVVTKVFNTGYIKLCKNRKLQPGCLLIKVQDIKCNPDDLLSNLKTCLKQFKDSIAAWREYEEKKERFMTQDMKALREYILNGPGQTYQKSTSNDENESNQFNSPPQVLTNENPLKSNDDEEVNIKPTVTQPSDYVLKLTFRTQESKDIPVPPVPRVFTGESRIGEIWSGKELCEKYLSESGLNRFISSCDGDTRIANKMYQNLSKYFSKQ